jgi:hypothetical protein
LRNPSAGITIDPAVIDKGSLSPNEVACALSHISVYQRIINDGADRALVLEDDIDLPADLRGLTDAIAPHVTGAEVTLLNFDSVKPCLMAREGALPLPGSRKLVLPLDVRQPLSGAAYVVSHEACERMSKGFFPIRIKADDWGYRFDVGMLDRVRCVVPLAVMKNPAFSSTMDYNPQYSLKARLAESIARNNVKPLERAIAFRRRWKWRDLMKVEIVNRPFVNKPSRLE